MMIAITTLLTPVWTSTSIVKDDTSDSAFHVIQDPSRIKITVGTTITLELRTSPAIFTKIDSVLLFTCMLGSINNCYVSPINMSRNDVSSAFHYSWKPDCSNTQIRYRFIVYCTNGTPYCLPDSIQFENNPSIIKGDSGLYYFTIEIIEQDNHSVNTLFFPFSAFVLGLAAITALVWYFSFGKKETTN